MKPFRILEDLNEKKSPSSAENESGKDRGDKTEETTWRYGPAAYWYDHLEPSKYIITQSSLDTKKTPKVLDKKKVYLK